MGTFALQEFQVTAYEGLTLVFLGVNLSTIQGQSPHDLSPDG